MENLSAASICSNEAKKKNKPTRHTDGLEEIENLVYCCNMIEPNSLWSHEQNSLQANKIFVLFIRIYLNVMFMDTVCVCVCVCISSDDLAHF